MSDQVEEVREVLDGLARALVRFAVCACVGVVVWLVIFWVLR